MPKTRSPRIRGESSWLGPSPTTFAVRTDVSRRWSTASGQPHDLGQRLELLGVAADRVEQEMVRAHAHELLQPLTHLLGRAVHTGGIGAVRVVIDRREPVV